MGSLEGQPSRLWYRKGFNKYKRFPLIKLYKALGRIQRYFFHSIWAGGGGSDFPSSCSCPQTLPTANGTWFCDTSEDDWQPGSILVWCLCTEQHEHYREETKKEHSYRQVVLGVPGMLPAEAIWQRRRFAQHVRSCSKSVTFLPC